MSDLFTNTVDDAPGSGHRSRRRHTKKGGWFRRHKALSTLIAILLALVLAVLGFIWFLNHKLGEIPRMDLGLDPNGQSVLQPEKGKGLTFLMVGVDNGNAGGGGVQAMGQGKWQAGKFRSDTMMLVHIPQDHKQAYVFSMPRDSWVDVPGFGTQKLNAAFSYGGPALLIQTLKGLGLPEVNHLIAVDWNGFKFLTDKLGGVELNGQNMNGDEALAYVRVRKSLPNGDFDRIKRQQNFLRAVMHKIVGEGLVSSPKRLLGTLDWAKAGVLVDVELDNGKIRNLAAQMRNLRPANVHFYTVPTKGTGMEGKASVVYLDKPAARELFGAITTDEVAQYLESHAGEYPPLGAPSTIQ